MRQYGRNMDQIHGLGAGVSMATSGAHAVQGGNWRIFKEMLDESNAGVYLNTTVSLIAHARGQADRDRSSISSLPILMARPDLRS